MGPLFNIKGTLKAVSGNIYKIGRRARRLGRIKG